MAKLIKRRAKFRMRASLKGGSYAHYIPNGNQLTMLEALYEFVWEFGMTYDENIFIKLVRMAEADRREADRKKPRWQMPVND